MPAQARSTPWDLLFYEAARGTSVFKEEYLVADPLVPWMWGTYAGRLLRYRLNWSLCDGSSYSDVHLWSRAMRKKFGVYRWSRPIFTPGFRIMEFHATHIWGGGLDLQAGDGKGSPSALPIIDVASPRLRPMLGRVWRDSNWQTKKDRIPRWGSSMGDAAIEIVDDPNKQQARLRPVHPASLAYLTTDENGNARDYDLVEFRPDPEAEVGHGEFWPLSKFTKRVRRDGDSVRFETLKDDLPYDWRESFYRDSDRRIGSEWTEQYGFTPLVLTKHLDVGLEWGWSEIHPAVARAREVDDLGSIVTDQARRILNSGWILNSPQPSGKVFKKAEANPNEFDTPPLTDPGSADGSGVTTVIGRDKMQLYWIDPKNNDMKPVQPFQLVGNMPINEIGSHIDRLMNEMKEDYPELRLEGMATGDSGRARRLAQSRAIAKVQARRPNYDDALVRAQMMALSIGGAHRGKKAYPGFDGIDRDSYSNGDLYHRIGDRSVMQVDTMDTVEEEQARATVLRTYKEAGVSVSLAMTRLGYAEDVVKEQKEREDQAAALADKLAEAKTNASANAPVAAPLLGGPKPPAQVGTVAQNRGANPPTDRQAPIYSRPQVPMETRQGA
jgi:hypothetical protein